MRTSTPRDVCSKLKTTWAAAPDAVHRPGVWAWGSSLRAEPVSWQPCAHVGRFPPSRGSCARTVFHTPCDASSHEKRPRVTSSSDPESLIDIVVANEYPQMFSDRAAAALGGRDVVSDPSRSTDLDVLGRLLTTITDNLIFDRLTLIERTKAGTFDSGDMDEHVPAAVLGLNESIALRRVEPFDSAGSHHGLLDCTNLSGRTTIVRSLIRNQRCLGKTHPGMRNKQGQVRT